MANKVPTDGHKTLNVQQSSFLSAIYDKEDKYRSLMVKNGMNKFSKARNPLVQSARSDKGRNKNKNKRQARKSNTSRSMSMSARSQYSNTARSQISTGRRSDVSSLAEMSRRAFDYERTPFYDPKFSARTHDSSARSITARTNTARAEVEREEKNVEEMLRRKKWLMKQLNELDAELSVIKEEAGI
eukprot:g3370.t1